MVELTSSTNNLNRSAGFSSTGLNSVMITEFGNTLGFLNHPIFFVFPFGSIIYDFPPLSPLPPEFLI